MSQNWPTSGPNYVPAYQSSGIPYVTTSVAFEVQAISTATAEVRETTQVSFPYITKFVTVRNTGQNELRMGFTSRGLFDTGDELPDSAGSVSGTPKSNNGSNYFLIPTASDGNTSATHTFDIRCTRLFFITNQKNANPNDVTLSGSFSILAGLTTINSSEFPILTGSSGFIGVG